MVEYKTCKVCFTFVLVDNDVLSLAPCLYTIISKLLFSLTHFQLHILTIQYFAGKEISFPTF